MASKEITSGQPRWWAIEPRHFGQANISFKAEPTDPAEAAQRAAAMLQSDLIADLKLRRVAAGYRSWRAMTAESVGLGITQTRLAEIVRGEAWLRLHHAEALGRLLGQPLLVPQRKIRALRAEKARLLKANKELGKVNEELRRANERLEKENGWLKSDKWSLEQQLNVSKPKANHPHT